MYDIAVIGAGMAGMATAARLQAAGLQTLVLEAHGLPGGCAGYFRRSGFAFDVGATTLVDFEPNGVGGELLRTIGMPPLDGEVLPGYVGWLPDRTVTLHRDHALWESERLRALGDTPAHRDLWAFFDELASVFWTASRRGVKLPIRSLADALSAAKALGLRHLPLARYLSWTVGDALRARGLQDDAPLRALLSMLIEDTVHGTLDQAPLLNGVLGATIRGAGLTRARGGMYGFWRRFTAHYRRTGGELRVGTTVTAIRGTEGDFTVETSRGPFRAHRIVSALPAQLTARIGPAEVREALAPFLRRDRDAVGGALVVFLGVPEEEVTGVPWTHHQLLQSYDAPLGDGNNMFISVSAPGDTESAPAGHRAVMISTHCELAPWEGLTDEAYARSKREAGERLVGLARRVYPNLGSAPQIHRVGTPRTYERFTRRLRGAVGGFRLSQKNANQNAIPHDIGMRGFWLCGDTTWPGLGTVACVLGSRIVATSVLGGRAEQAYFRPSLSEASHGA
ncbi:phytoene desaturase family protein [Pendulispora albinea]|uniref:NAD(P)/FAD-dependent oxidoreductase n=1 Tax=Pendulispora albinea TaxID=2741071 RepID=A0ABZ2LZU6_9BACT